LPEPAFVVVVGVSSGTRSTIVLAGIPGLTLESSATAGSYPGMAFGVAQLAAGTYHVAETTIYHASNAPQRTELLGLFAFSNSKAGFIDKSVIQTIATVPVGSNPYAATYDSGKGEVFVSDEGANNVSVINDTSNTVVAIIAAGNNTDHMAYDPAKGEIFVTNTGSNNVSVIDDATNSVVANINVTANPQGIAYDSAKRMVFVGGGSGISVISTSTNKVVRTIAMGGNILSLAYDSGKGEIFATAFVGSYTLADVNVINDTNYSVVASVPVGYQPQMLAYDPTNGEVFVAVDGVLGTWRGVFVINDTTNTGMRINVYGAVNGTIGWFNYPSGLVYDGGTGELFITCWISEVVGVMSTSTNRMVGDVWAGATPPLVSAPVGVAYDSAKGEIFVAFSFANDAAVMSDGTG